MKIIKRITEAVKREIRLYLIFRRLDHTQIEAMRRQAVLIEAAKRRKQAGRFEYSYSLRQRADGLTVLEWRKAVA